MGPSSPVEPNDKPRVEIYGPLGLRALIRTQLTLCFTGLQGKYVVHELLWPEQIQQQKQQASASTSTSSYGYAETQAPLSAAVHGPQRVIPLLPFHESELLGRDIVLDEATASWSDFTSVNGVSISAAPILHRCPTVGYVFKEPPQASPLPSDTFQRLDANAERLLSERGVRNPRSLVGKLIKQRERVDLPDGTFLDPPPLDIKGRKICVCGDTRDATGGLPAHKGLVPLAQNSDVLVHESTNIALPVALSQSKKPQTFEEVTEKASSRGHSTPQGAGAFAGSIRASALLLNHFSVRYPAPHSRLLEEFANGNRNGSGSGALKADRAFQVMQEFAEQATQAWHAAMPQDDPPTAPWRSRRAIPSWDGLTYDVWREDQVQGRSGQAATAGGATVNGVREGTHRRFDSGPDHRAVGNGSRGGSGGHRGGRLDDRGSHRHRGGGRGGGSGSGSGGSNDGHHAGRGGGGGHRHHHRGKRGAAGEPYPRPS
ncbi:hypothetical protein BCV69DRAFT_281196 [Microstroma glucosiphilum]|uniref:Metallo-beta-lactamase domain-containing protein n=1 Tax=Pseudomicrostroma glucosiphilum TaxID=1684307 RepID=A0A316UCP8_9BASI|nr:hypothetical protein BCV69DRAFT_281196 [Pseudomicrostroma glucosiphilum]PWN22191.1 hypothetical protein BCV69DRAFT_281196 [Pseudomicrostroma glucosiphilum]